MALPVIGRPSAGFQQMPDYTGYAEAINNGVVMHRLFNDTGSAHVSRTAYYEVSTGSSSADLNAPRAIALVDDAKRHTLVVALEAVADQKWGWYAFKGLVDNVIVASAARTTGHALKVLDGVITSTGAAPDYDDEEFGMNLQATETGVVLDVLLLGREFIATT